MRLHQTEKLLNSKENSVLSEEIASRMGENLCRLYILITRIYRELKTTHLENNQQSIDQMGK
jgi:isoleucyl-tRNA synthetase